jgi:hypothetical protein
MTQRLLFILRQSPDWHGLAADFTQGVEIDPIRFRPPEPVPGFPGNIDELIGLWNERFGVDFFTCRSRLKEMCEDSIAQIPGADRISYRDVESFGRQIKKYVAFYHDDDDWFSPDMGTILEEVLPRKYDVCVFPLVRLSAETATLVRQVGKPPAIQVGRPRPFSHRYQSNNYGINGRACDRETFLGMKDHVLASEYANSHGLRDAYIDRIISATAKTPCSAQVLMQVFQEPAEAEEFVRRYVAALGAAVIPDHLPWISDRLKKVVELFTQALEQPPAASARLRKPDPSTPFQRHYGVKYAKFLRLFADRQTPSSYLEIGPRNGEAVAQMYCDAVCVDPDFALTFNVAKRQRTSLFQMTSDAFFAAHDIREIFPQGIDLALLRGSHLFELLLRDFINVEKFCHKNSTILLHNCLPYSEALAGRERMIGAWTGDIWKILPILKKYRPDLKVNLFDCPPTGLVSCTNLDPDSTVLSDSYDKIVSEFLNARVPRNLGTLYPRVSTKALVMAPDGLARIFPPPGNGPSGLQAVLSDATEAPDIAALAGRAAPLKLLT